jgi:exopolyphosphatase/guanosine-5'-triphosphate,3'-diphosphate pyrophosphatase
MSRVAVVDIGSNSTRLLVADVQDGRVTAELERISTVTRLGSGVDKDGHLREDAMERVFGCSRRWPSTPRRSTATGPTSGSRS